MEYLLLFFIVFDLNCGTTELYGRRTAQLPIRIGGLLSWWFCIVVNYLTWMYLIMALEVEWWMGVGGLLCYAAARRRRDGKALVHWLWDWTNRIELKKTIFDFERKSWKIREYLCRAHLISTPSNFDQPALSWWRLIISDVPLIFWSKGKLNWWSKVEPGNLLCLAQMIASYILQPTPPWKIARTCVNAARAKPLATTIRPCCSQSEEVPP